MTDEQQTMREFRISQIVALLAVAADEFKTGHIPDIGQVREMVKAAFALAKLVVTEARKDGTH